jgi:cytochrome b561
MQLKNSASEYGSLAIAGHWLTVLLIAAAYALMELKDVTPKGSPGRAAMASWHYTIGLVVFVVAWLRVALRATGPTPKIDPPAPEWEERLARIVHGALYVLMIGAPLLGVLMLSAKGEAIPFFGLELPAMIGKDKELGRTFGRAHWLMANAGYALIGLHAAAALFHHYVRKDRTLAMMLPRR